MSRTYRSYPEDYYHGNGEFIKCNDIKDHDRLNQYYTFAYCEIYGEKQREKKFQNVPKWFKKMNRRIEKAKAKEAMKRGNYESIPRFKTRDAWEWW